MKVFFLAALIASAIATPIELEGRNNVIDKAKYCAAVKNVVIPAKDKPAATTYCQSLLSLKPRATKVVTRTITNAKVTATVTSVRTTTVACLAPSSSIVKREPNQKATSKPKPMPKPSCLTHYTKTAAISSACSCLNIPTGTVTSTTTKILTGTVTVTSVQTAAITPSAFHLRALSDDETLNGHETTGRADRPAVLTPYTGTLWSLDAQGQLRNASYSDLIANVDGTTSSKPRRNEQSFVYFSDLEEIEEDERVPLNCKIVPRADQTCALECYTEENPVGLINSTPDVDPDYEQRWVLDKNAAGPVFTHIIVPDE